jgi:hypothetical protein
MSDNQVAFSRAYVNIINVEKYNIIADFAQAEYIATKDFFNSLSTIYADLADDGIATFNGTVVNLNELAGAVGLQFQMEILETSYQSQKGLAKLGLNIEKNIWKNL